jgi:hypothetical protein
MSPVTFGAGNDRAPRLVALATKVLWIIQQSGQLYVAVLDPANPSATPSFGTILTSGIGSTAKYDVCQVGTRRHGGDRGASARSRPTTALAPSPRAASSR